MSNAIIVLEDKPFTLFEAALVNEVVQDNHVPHIFYPEGKGFEANFRQSKDGTLQRAMVYRLRAGTPIFKKLYTSWRMEINSLMTEETFKQIPIYTHDVDFFNSIKDDFPNSKLTLTPQYLYGHLDYKAIEENPDKYRMYLPPVTYKDLYERNRLSKRKEEAQTPTEWEDDF